MGLKGSYIGDGCPLGADIPKQDFVTQKYLDVSRIVTTHI
jgi:hypothetical protein